MNKREEIARAICLKAFGYERPMILDYEIADAVLDALMRPTPEMVEAGEDFVLAEDAWHAMVQAAKDGK